jgi:ribonuclease HII
MLLPYFRENAIECGCDEAGRGCLAGPVVAAAVILDPRLHIPGLHDSKQLSHKKREILQAEIKEKSLAWAVGICSPQEIDQYNILRASFRAMHKAIGQLTVLPELLLVDGNRFDAFENIPHVCLIKGDARYQAIAAASILAKTYRDNLMEEIDQQYPNYGWKQNKGYPTKAHFEALQNYGITSHHRRSFRLNRQLSLFEE